ncbi:hypothetical protein ACTTAL_09685 [Rhodobacter capsulatus]|nr:hypothetical protein [Rhodobacter capsulatus]
MAQLPRSLKLHAFTLPILSILGIVCAIYWPQAHGAFCAGLTSTVV